MSVYDSDDEYAGLLWVAEAQAPSAQTVAAEVPATSGQTAEAVVSRWKFTPSNGLPFKIRSRPSINKRSNRGSTIQPNTVFDVCEERVFDQITCLKLADGRGWLFDRSVACGGTLCVRVKDVETTVGSSASSSGVVGSVDAADLVGLVDAADLVGSLASSSGEGGSVDASGQTAEAVEHVTLTV